MKALPPLSIVADRGKVCAFRVNGDGHLEALASIEIPEGHQKISSVVTDQAGSFPVSGSMGNSAAEEMTVTAELESRCLHRVADEIRSVLDQHEGWWTFVAPSEINAAILDFLGAKYQGRLSMNLKKDLVGLPIRKLENRLLAVRANQF